MQTVALPGRKRKDAPYSPEQVAEAITRLNKVKVGEGVAFDENTWFDTEAKARTKARDMALLIVAHEMGKDMPQPRTHVLPSEDGAQFTPVISPRRKS